MCSNVNLRNVTLHSSATHMLRALHRICTNPANVNKFVTKTLTQMKNAASDLLTAFSIQ